VGSKMEKEKIGGNGNEMKNQRKEGRKRIERKGRKAGVEKGGCLSSGQVQLTLNCLALELEHLSVPEGLEEWSTD